MIEAPYFPAATGQATVYDRTLPTSGSEAAGSSQMDALNLLFIVGFAILISVLARYLSTRRKR